MTTLDELIAGKITNPKRITLSCELTEFPDVLYSYADTLEILDLSANKLSTLPEDIYRFTKLKIAFFSQNNFTIFPKQLATCPSLTMIGFKSNQLEEIPEDAFPKNLQWLILTDNRIQKLPRSIGQCTRLQKFAIAGNRLTELPLELSFCKNLELLRISANQLTSIPSWLYQLPRLSWLAFSGNPVTYMPKSKDHLPMVDWSRITVEEQLGEGASGVISKAKIDGEQEVAIKIFKGEVTSDGYPEDELATCLSTGLHENIVPLRATIANHPEGKQGIVMELIPAEYKNLGQPPSFSTCTRDVFPAEQQFTYKQGVAILNGVLQAVKHLHERGIMHGDLYAHNTMINEQGKTYFGDFGAATFYAKNLEEAPYLERLDIRAFGCLLEDVISLIREEKGQETLCKLYEKCMLEDVISRPSFEEIAKVLADL
jgi:tRNA A-37 threonylcarbamoyl transferase component Bud32